MLLVLLCRSLLRFLLLGEAQLLRRVEGGVVVAIFVVIVVLFVVVLLRINLLQLVVSRLRLTGMAGVFCCWGYNGTILHQLVFFEHYLSIMRNSYFSIYLPTLKKKKRANI